MKKITKITFSIILFASVLQIVAAEELTLVTMNTWPAMDSHGFLSCEEWEAENDRIFRNEILSAALSQLEADVIVLNGLNPAPELAESIAAELGMTSDAWVSRSGIRLGPVSLPVNLKEGDAILTSAALTSEPAGRLHMNGIMAGSNVTLFSRNGVQVIGSLITIGEKSVYLFSAVWTESLFDDEKSLDSLLEEYLNGNLEGEDYLEGLSNALEGSATRRAQAAETLSFINSIAGADPVILMGSLNALPGSRELDILIDAGFVDVFERAGRGRGYTIDTVENSSFEKIPEDSLSSASFGGTGRYRCDYIMIRGAGLKPVSAEIVMDKPVYGVYPSNRYGVKAVIEF